MSADDADMRRSSGQLAAAGVVAGVAQIGPEGRVGQDLRVV
jgi:hypothetical protein